MSWSSSIFISALVSWGNTRAWGILHLICVIWTWARHGCACLQSGTLRGWGRRNCCKFKFSLGYIVNSKPFRAREWEPVLKHQTNRTLGIDPKSSDWYLNSVHFSGYVCLYKSANFKIFLFKFSFWWKDLSFYYTHPMTYPPINSSIYPFIHLVQSIVTIFSRSWKHRFSKHIPVLSLYKHIPLFSL